MLFVPCARAQLGVSLSLQSEARFRGQGVSDGRPVAGAELVYDLPGGFYVGGSASAVASRHDGPKPHAFREYLGLTRPVRKDVMLDIGVVHSGYTRYSGFEGSYTEAYVGLVGRRLSTHVFLSPGYFHKDVETIYVEVDGNVSLTRDWLVFGHTGVLAPLGGGPQEVTADWRVGVRRRVGRVDITAAWAGNAQAERSYSGRDQSGDSALVFGITVGL